MRNLFLILLLNLGLISTAFAMNLYCQDACVNSGYSPSYCHAVCSYDFPYYYHQVDKTCVDFCIDYEHTLTQCEQACSN